MDSGILDIVIERADVVDGALPREVERQLAAQPQSQEEVAMWRAAPGTKVILRFSTLDDPYRAMIKGYDPRRVAKRAVVDPRLGMTRDDLRKYVISLQSCTVVTFAHDTGDACHALAFRTDGEPLLVTASASGQLYVWHLERRELDERLSWRCGGGARGALSHPW